MRLLILLLFVVLTRQWLHAQADFDSNKISIATSQLIQEMSRINQVMSAAVYSSGVKPDQYTLFEQLREQATEEELITLTNHPNGVVRCYAFWALASCSRADLFPYVLQHLPDTARVQTQFGCILSVMRVGDFFIDVTKPDYIDVDLQKLTDQQRVMLDSLLLYLPYELNARDWAIGKAAPTEQNYSQIRHLATVEQYLGALIPLARYRRPVDIPVILQAWKKGSHENNFYCYHAVQAFPDPAFFPFACCGPASNHAERSLQY